jgi:hypothetical protein
VGLTSGAFALVLGLAVTAALVGVLLGWRRLGRPGARRVAARATALFLLQAGVLALVFVLANRSLVFYSSWSDLLGSDSAGAAVRPAQAAQTTATDTVQVLDVSAVTVPGIPAAAGDLAAVRIHGQLSGLTVQGQLYLPAGYGQPVGRAAPGGRAGSARERYPPVPGDHCLHRPARLQHLALRGPEPGGDGRRADRRGTDATGHPADPAGRTGSRCHAAGRRRPG